MTASTYPATMPPAGTVIGVVGGRPVYAVAGGSEAPPEPTPKTFSQDDLNNVSTRSRDEGKRQGKTEAEQQVATDLGVSVEEAKRIIAESKRRSDEQKSEAERAKDAADAEKKAAADEKKAAASERHDTKLERFLLRAGVEAKLLARALRSLNEVEIGADDAVIEKAVGDLKKDVPGLFGEADKEPAPEGDPGKPPAKPSTGGKSKIDEGRERARKMGWSKETNAA